MIEHILHYYYYGTMQHCALLSDDIGDISLQADHCELASSNSRRVHKSPAGT